MTEAARAMRRGGPAAAPSLVERLREVHLQMLDAVLSGEGLVVDLAGPGEVLMQSRNMGALITWIRSLIPSSSS